VTVMVLSKSALPQIVALRRSVGRPVGPETRRIEAHTERVEQVETFRRIRFLGNVIHYATLGERPDIADHAAGELVSLADRRLARMGEGPEAA
jgi:hypothetical protein